MDTRKQRLLCLHDTPYVTRPLLKKLLKLDPHLITPFSITPRQLSQMVPIPITRAEKIIRTVQDPNIMKKLDKYQQNYTLLTWFDPQYPASLRSIPDPPLVLYVQGNLDILNTSSSLSVIGTRNPSPYAYPAMRLVLTPLIQQGMTIVSGMAKGIDQYAHTLSLEYGGRTMAVLGSGFHHIYPRNNLSLYNQMAKDHIVISEYPPDRPPKRYYFPERNRIISGLTPSTFVIEARMKSGTMITVDQALEQGRSVYALPGPAGSLTSEGCHYLINEGAKLVHTHHDLMNE
ncbi:DNA-processing protein DprA [Halobacillus litoralis]|uniref:DNA-processing protein DprA n=1 Tax=Halobacillus litoralis TaxID=45668 RepID=UPI001CFD8948|nr:DNA-processing protein DprA [Halobacillus litoralis]